MAPGKGQQFMAVEDSKATTTKKGRVDSLTPPKHYMQTVHHRVGGILTPLGPAVGQ